MTWFMFFCLWFAISNTNNGYAIAIIFVAWCVLVYLIFINGGFNE